ncbi:MULTISPECIES: hypothetical protein [unclassified Streptomyces]|uniref:hypothetical protein n=1 Tax=unclassified Streptomyces TaxID=2593676 RepID=UPI0034419A7F
MKEEVTPPGYTREKFPHWITQSGTCDTTDRIRRFAAAQALARRGGIITALDGCRWVSHPAAMARRVQAGTTGRRTFRRAADRPTLITNQPEAVQAFAAETDGPIICKPVASPVLVEGDQLKAVYSRHVTDEDLADLRGPGLTAHLFQAWVEGRLSSCGGPVAGRMGLKAEGVVRRCSSSAVQPRRRALRRAIGAACACSDAVIGPVRW